MRAQFFEEAYKVLTLEYLEILALFFFIFGGKMDENDGGEEGGV